MLVRLSLALPGFFNPPYSGLWSYQTVAGLLHRAHVLVCLSTGVPGFFARCNVVSVREVAYLASLTRRSISFGCGQLWRVSLDSRNWLFVCGSLWESFCLAAADADFFCACIWLLFCLTPAQLFLSVNRCGSHFVTALCQSLVVLAVGRYFVWRFERMNLFEKQFEAPLFVRP